MPIPVTQAQLARIRGVSRAAVGKHMRPGGRLHAARLPGAKVDLDHEVVKDYLADIDLAELPSAAVRPFVPPTAPAHKRPLPRDTTITFDELARMKGCSVDEVAEAIAGPLADALVPAHHVALVEFARLAGASPVDVVGAVRDALTSAGRVDVAHSAALACLAGRHRVAGPLPDAKVPEGFLAPAVMGDDAIDMGHPLAVAFLVRQCGKVPELGEPA